jgi:diacylglycerol O-acyltransferase
MSTTQSHPSASAGTGGVPALRYDTRLNPSDTVLWNIERDPTLRTTIVAIAVLDKVPDWHRLRDRIMDGARDVPRLRQRVMSPPFGIAPPRWEDDPHFDLDYHLRRVALPPPGDFAALLELAAPIAMAPFDRARPLWEFTLVEGLEGGRAALIEKMHHAFTDGVGGMQLARAFVDADRDGPRRGAQRRVPTAPAHPTRERGIPGRDMVETLGAQLKGATTAALGTSRLALGAFRDPWGFAARTARGTRSVARLLSPATAPLSPLMQHRGLSRRLAAFDVDLADALAAGHAAGGTLNDAFLAAVAGGMMHYHERHGVNADALRVTMPVNRRRVGDPSGNNRFTPVRFTVPLTSEGPDARMRRLGELARRWRREPALPVSDVIAGVLNRLPVVTTTAVFGSMLKGVDFVATNVPGLTDRVYLAGAEVLRHYAFAPPSGAAVSIALTSHGDVGCIGITADPDAIPDTDVFSECLQLGFAEVLDVGRE